MGNTIQKDINGPQYYVCDFAFGKYEDARVFDGIPDLIEVINGKIKVYEGERAPFQKKGKDLVSFFKKKKKLAPGTLTFKDEIGAKFDYSNFYEASSFCTRLRVMGKTGFDEVRLAASKRDNSPRLAFVLPKDISDQIIKRHESTGSKDVNSDGLDDEYYEITENDQPIGCTVGLAAFAERPVSINILTSLLVGSGSGIQD